METCYKDYGPIFRVWLGIFPTFVMTDPTHLQVILGSSKHVDKSWIYTFLINFLGNGLITSSGKKLVNCKGFHISNSIIVYAFIR